MTKEAAIREIAARLAESSRFKRQLRNSGAGGNVVAVAFPRPGENWYREHHRKPQVSVFVILAQITDGSNAEMLFKPGGRRLLGAFIADLDFKIERPGDSVEQVTVVGSRRDLEERWTFFLSGVGGITRMHGHSSR